MLCIPRGLSTSPSLPMHQSFSLAAMSHQSPFINVRHDYMIQSSDCLNDCALLTTYMAFSSFPARTVKNAVYVMHQEASIGIKRCRIREIGENNDLRGVRAKTNNIERSWNNGG